jgi:uncharacterized membrane protein HdeD (DUF308 family)
MQPKPPESPPVTLAAPPAAKRAIWRGVLLGLLPLALGAGPLVLALALTALARQVTAERGFFFQQRLALGILLAGLTLAALACALATARLWRRVQAWRNVGNHAQARGAALGLLITALALLLPLLLALFLPQHPTP